MLRNVWFLFLFGARVASFLLFARAEVRNQKSSSEFAAEVDRFSARWSKRGTIPQKLLTTKIRRGESLQTLCLFGWKPSGPLSAPGSKMCSHRLLSLCFRFLWCDVNLGALSYLLQPCEMSTAPRTIEMSTVFNISAPVPMELYLWPDLASFNHGNGVGILPSA